jgi:hypothetical protein
MVMYFVSFPKINILLIHHSQIIKYFNIGVVVCVDTGTVTVSVGEPNSVTVLSGFTESFWNSREIFIKKTPPKY